MAGFADVGDVVCGADLEVKGNTRLAAAAVFHTTNVNAATYDTLSTDYCLLVAYSVTGTCAIRLMTADMANGRVITIKDSGGNAATHNITISTEGVETIDGAATAVIAANYGVVRLISDGSNWYIV